MSKPRAAISLRPLLAAADFAAVGSCLSIALYFVHQKSTSTSWDSVLSANLLLGLLLLVGAVLGFAFFDLYSRPPRGRWPSASPVRAASRPGLATLLVADTLAEVPAIMCGLTIAVTVALCFGHLFGSLERDATLEPVTVVLAALLAVVIVPLSRALLRLGAAAVESH